MKYKQIFAAVTAFCMLMCGCEKIDNSDINVPVMQEVQTLEESILLAEEDVLTTTARTEEISIPENAGWLYNYTQTKDGMICVGSNGSSNETHVFQFYADSSEWSDTALVPPASYDGYYYHGGLIDFGENACYCLTVMENHSNMEPYIEGNENYDWDLYNETWESDYYLCTYTTDGTLAGKIQVEGLEEYRSWEGYDQFTDLYCDGKNTYLVLQDSTILRINNDGTLTETCPAEDRESNGSILMNILHDRDRKPICYRRQEAYTEENGVIEITTLSDFNVQTGKPGEPVYISENKFVSDQSISSGGYGDYRMFITESEGDFSECTYKLYGIRDDGTKEVVIDWDASDLESMDVTPLPDGTFIGQNSSDKLYRISRKYASEITESQTIMIGVLGTEAYIKDFVRDFNSKHEDYRLQTIVYKNSDGSYFGDPNGNNDALDKLKLAVISNDAPDLIFMQDYHDTILKLGSKGVFCNLYEMMERDTEVNRDVILPNVLTAMEHLNGELYSLTSSFHVDSIAVKSKFITKENWTVDDMIDLYDGSDNIMYYWSTKQNTLKMLLMGTDFTDELNGTCSFDSPEFVKILEFCNRYPAESTEPKKNYDDETAMEKFNQWHLDSYLKYQHDEDYLYPTRFGAISGSAIASGWAYTKADLGGDFTLVGYPSNNGKGGKIIAKGEMAVISTCENKSAAWEVIKAYIQEDDPENIQSGYSIYDAEFEKQLDDEMYIMNSGERTDEEYYDDDSRIYPLTQQERDGLEAYIRNCDTYMMLDEKVENIVYEEADMYFNGDKSAEDTAKTIQNRAEIYLSEQS